ncbi:MAG: phage terminase large subunit family protein [Planctomycetes bacterium]|nr:phage terminase large subunit family protein [Planctomycetota bacterium]
MTMTIDPKWTTPPRIDRAEADAWRPPEHLSPTEWADRFRFLDPLVNAAGGRYSSDFTPYAREWLDNAAIGWVRQTTIVAGTQIGKTETINNAIGFAIAQDPGPAMLVVPRAVDIQTTQERRLVPMIDATPVLREQRTDHAHDEKRREMLFRRSILYLRSSQSPADLASVPVRYLFCDEVDKYPGWSGREAAPLDLARERQRTFWNATTYVVSTPTTRDGTVYREFLDGDRRRYWLPCPFCNWWQLLEWKQIRIPPTVRTAKEMRRERSATYHCSRCNVAIPDTAKRDMLRRGVWIPEGHTAEAWLGGERDRDRADHRSYHIWAAYSPWLTWWEIAAKFLKAKADPASSLMNWVNSWLAEVWEDKVEAPTDDNVAAAIVPGLTMGGGEQVPPHVLVATAGIDVQKDRAYYVVRGWGYDEESWLLAAGQVATLEELGDVLFRNVWASRGSVGVRCALMDSRYRRDEVVDLARRWPQLRLGVGVDRQGPIDFTTARLEKHPRTGQPLPNSLLIWSLSVGRFKDYVAHRMRKPETWHLPEDLPDGYRAQVTSEHKIRVRTGARDVERWVVKPGSAANHYWDAEVYAAAAAKMIRVELLKRRGDEPPGAPPPPSKRPRPPGPPRRDREREPSRFPRLSR